MSITEKVKASAIRGLFGCAISRRDRQTAPVEVRQALDGRYTLLSKLGSGGMAVVWRARDEVLGRPVAVKVLAGRFAGDPLSRARIRDEARSAATLSHPNIAQVYDYGEADEDGTARPYVVMELVNGPTLQQRVSSGPLPPRTIFRICGEVAAGLAAAHEDGLVHRDIKMANIMVTPTGVKVVDFGIAAAAGPVSPEEGLIGTPAYLAPERLTSDEVVPASDVYALGVLLYRLLAHESPWSVESTPQMLEAHVYVDPQPLPELPGVPATVARLIDRCLLKDPADRPTATEVAATLGDAAEAAAGDVSAPRYAARPNDNSAVAAALGDVGKPNRGAAVLDRPLRPSEARSTGVRKKYVLVVGGLAVVTAALITWFLTPEDPARPGPPQAVDAPASAATSAIRASVFPSVGAVGTRPGPGADDLPRPGPGAVIAGNGVVLSAAPTAATPAAPTDSRPPRSSASGQPPPPSSQPAPPPQGKRLESRGGAVFATCAQGKATVTGWEPAEGFTAQPIEPGPAITARILFAGATAKYRMAVTCVGQTPTQVVLPL